MNPEPKTMKWWGWGDEDTEFDMRSRPDLWAYIRRNLSLPEEPRCVPPASFESLVLPECRVDRDFLAALERRLAPGQIADGKKERLTHAFGKSFRDLYRVRRGLVPYAPDCVVYPQSDQDVGVLVEAAGRHHVRLIPFGGGSNIAGCLEPPPAAGMVVSVDMRRMSRLVALDADSGTARFQAGVLGPQLEAELNRAGFTLGHFPDSFLYSTLGGWVATRSAGMQSDRYGKIEDMVMSMRMVTPVGTIETRAVPKASNGIDVNQLCIGSEGTLGVITEVLLNVHRLPDRKATYGYLFPDFESGVLAMQQCRREGCVPVLTRLNDPNKTALSFAYRKPQPFLKQQLGRVVKSYLKHVRSMNLDRACLMLVGFEGSEDSFERDRRKADAIYRKLRAFPLGAEPGRAFQAGKYDFPYLRDYLCDRGVLADVSETATVWSRLLPLYEASRRAIEDAIAAGGTPGWVGCHVSHSYHAGAALYFTFGVVAREGHEMAQYLRVKKAAEDSFLENGASLSHHHAVGYEHLPWLEQDVSVAGVKAIQGLKRGLDPDGVMNPGKLVSGFTFTDWGLPPERDIEGSG
jgi:alkyldihydroxyacetonephosphate synthase